MTTIKPATPLLRPNSGALALVLLFLALFAFFLILLFHRQIRCLSR